MLRTLITGFIEHKEFIFFNFMIHFLVGVLLATAIYPFLKEEVKERYNYFMLIFFPAVFGSIFPDIIFLVSTLAEHRTLYGLFELLSSGGTVYSTFHSHVPLLLVIPTTVFLVLIINKIFGKWLDQLPSWNLLFISLISGFAAGLHLFLDSVGF